ncbi:MAG: two-component sensor histidine kinase, partial [Deferribacterales bacterium]|nr:two-component sensor histidine kinase [Deferribacterales bacterium]
YSKIEITDNGHGISEDFLNRLFIPFQTTKAKGTGLGLSIVYKIIKAHGGNIIPESKPNEYTSFKIIMPK